MRNKSNKLSLFFFGKGVTALILTTREIHSRSSQLGRLHFSCLSYPWYHSEKNYLKTLRQDVTITISFYCLFFQQIAIIQTVVEGYYFGKDSLQTKTGFVFSGTVDSAFASGKQKHKVVMRFHDKYYTYGIRLISLN